jgi:predicted DNA-binding transcriptional regulator YafY
VRAYPTRPALLRLSTIDRVLRESRPPTAGRLADMMEVSPRTVLRDIEYMRDMFHAPIAYDARARGYRYTEDGFALPAPKLTEGELVSVLVASSALEQYAGTPFEADLRRAFAKIEKVLPDEVSCSVRELASATSFGFSAPRTGDLQRFTRLTDAVRDRRRLRITYESASRGATSTRLVDPYHLTCRDGAWYLLAWCHRRREVRMFVPERIRAIEEEDAYFDPPVSFDPERYMGDAFRAMRGGRPARVRLEFTGLAARLVPERRWHPTQKIVTRPDRSVRLEMTVTGLDEVASWVMSFGGECRVVGPERLHGMVVKAGRALLRANRAGRRRFT